MTTFTLTRPPDSQPDARGRERFTVRWHGTSGSRGQVFFMQVREFVAAQQTLGNVVEMSP